MNDIASPAAAQGHRAHDRARAALGCARDRRRHYACTVRRTIRCAATGRLAAVHLAEFGAQAMAIHGGLLSAVAAGVSRNPRCWCRCAIWRMLRDYIDDLPGELEITRERCWSRAREAGSTRSP